MSSFFSLIKICPNVLSNDNITVGMILFSDSGHLEIKTSEKKVSLAKSVCSENSNYLVDFCLKEISKTVEKEQGNLLLKSQEFLNYQSFINENLFSYLADYSNGIIKFSDAVLVDLPKVSIDKLFDRFVWQENKNETPNHTEFVNRQKRNVEVKLIERVKEKVHTNIELTDDQIPTLSANFKLDCIGQNGVLVGALSLPFVSSVNSIKNRLNIFSSVVSHLTIKQYKILADNQIYVIADEPVFDSELSSFWNKLRKEENLLKIIPSDESEKVTEEIINRKATEFLVF